VNETVSGPNSPYPYFVADDLLSKEELRMVEEEWPKDSWPGWVEYNTPHQRKMASDTVTPIPPFCSRLLAKMVAFPVGKVLGMEGSVPDLSLYGAGLHEIRRGGKINKHLDADSHFRLGLQRVWSAMLYVHGDWQLSYGGVLTLFDTEGDKAILGVEPLPGRMVAFGCQKAWHSVGKVSSGKRRSLALFGYLPKSISSNRPKAHFHG